jgi:tRNA-splicing ligase RtcB
MRMTIFNVAPHVIEQKRSKLREILENSTCFGTGGAWNDPHDHPVLEDPAWQQLPLARSLKDQAWRQLGTSGSGNHFVEFGELIVHEEIRGQGEDQGEGSRTFGRIPSGNYFAILSHSGSRHLGAMLAEHYTQLAMNQHPELPKEYKHLAWLDLQGDGAEYWLAMTLAGRYASANHAVIHRLLADKLRFEILGGIENHHNYAWKEIIDGEELVVHRKGATPAGLGVYGVIPGTMVAPGYVVQGKGLAEAIYSAAHGAGRRVSRATAMNSFTWEQVEYKLKKAGVDLLSADLDEAPNAYKDIQQVMAAQADMVETVAEFRPRIVKMAPGKTRRRGEKERSAPDKKRKR